MRLRHITGSEDYVENSPYVCHDGCAFRGKWRQALFQNDRPLMLEIGMGKGRFIMETALRNPEYNYLGIERYNTVLLKALQKRERLEEHIPPLHNLYYLSMDARLLREYFAAGEISRIYLNFSDPWPKKRQANRRLTSPVFLTLYSEILSEDGTVEFKTDNPELFHYSLESLGASGWEVAAMTEDLHHDAVLNEGNVMTEYEEKFSSRGNPICKLIARPKPPPSSGKSIPPVIS